MAVYGFKFEKHPYSFPVQLNSVGWESISTTSYDWDNRNRRMFSKIYVVQYTERGTGAVQIGDITYTVEPGQAFLISFPGDNRYYYPGGNENWEFYFGTLYGTMMDKIWEQVTGELGPVPVFHKDSSIVRLLQNMYREAEKKRISDAFQASGLAYQFVMELLRAVRNHIHYSEQWPESIVRAMTIMRERYNEIQGPEDIAKELALSKYYYIHLFRKSTGMTTIQYLTKIRMEKAIELLRNTELSLAEIADSLGFSSVNYFNRVFNKMVGVSPGQFRFGRDTPRIDHITFD